ncbi:hypothetical protein GQ600_13554 [Phytophthora cactorum]|nr:hypothetical protein GQ600_13554 [Phytophthora cactorum]
MDVKRQALNAAEVKRSTVVEAIQYFQYLSNCCAKGIKPQPPTADIQNVIDLRKGLRVPEAAFYGSNIGRMRSDEYYHRGFPWGDKLRKAPKRGEGRFGIVRAFGASAETQIAADLHVHFAV